MNSKTDGNSVMAAAIDHDQIFKKLIMNFFKEMDYRKYLGSKNPLVYALMAKMGYDKREMIQTKSEFCRLIAGSKKINPARPVSADGICRNLHAIKQQGAENIRSNDR